VSLLCFSNTPKRITWYGIYPHLAHFRSACRCNSLASTYLTSFMCPYMQDEIFHVPQTAQYCRGHMTEWDPKITTFPGLYLLGAPYGLAMHTLQRLLRSVPWDAACSTSVLRSLNVLMIAAFFGVFAALYRKLHPEKQPEFATLMVQPQPLPFFYLRLGACMAAQYREKSLARTSLLHACLV
jgi:hypothetical protein